MPNPEMGKRYHCEVCGMVVLCLKPGTEPLVCDGEEMPLLHIEELPSGD